MHKADMEKHAGWSQAVQPMDPFYTQTGNCMSETDGVGSYFFWSTWLIDNLLKRHSSNVKTDFIARHQCAIRTTSSGKHTGWF